MSVVSGSLLWRKRTRWYKKTILDVSSPFGREGRDVFQKVVIPLSSKDNLDVGIWYMVYGIWNLGFEY